MLILPLGLLVAQDPVITPAISIDQNKLLQNCPVATAPGCQYPLKKVLSSGGQIYSTPLLPWDPATSTGDGHGEGPNGPRAGQRHHFNPFNPNYPYLRMNGIDSQSGFECHNSIGSSIQSYGPALMRKPYAVGGSAGSNSNAFINPLFPTDAHDGPITLFIRNPPHVFGTGYTQELGYELTTTLWLLKAQARTAAQKQQGKPYAIPLTVSGLDFGVYTTTYNGATAPSVIIADAASCPAAKNAPTNIGGEAGYTDDVTKVKGVPCDLVVRPFQWKGVSSSVRHFARDALDFHFSVQAFEKAAKCDCDGDGLAPELGLQPSVSIGNVSALVSFVTMMRPPTQAPRDPAAQRGFQIFTGTATGLPMDAGTKSMCATCHVASLRVLYPFVRVEWPTNPNDSEGHPIDPNNPSTWPVLEKDCPNGKPVTPDACPAETAYGATPNPGALVTPALSSFQLPVVRGVAQGLRALPRAGSLQSQVVAIRRQALFPGFPDYVMPLSAPATVLTNLQIPRLPANPNGTVDVPLFSDLQTHEMGSCLSDPTMWHGSPLPAQGTDVAGINTVPSQFLTRPLWGVADTGPWLHDGRARSLREAILLHGDTSDPQCAGSSAEPVIKVFRALSPQDQQAVVRFLLTLRLPTAAAALPR